MKINEVIQEGIFDNLKAAKQAYQGGGGIRGAMQAYGTQRQVGAHQADMKPIINNQIARWNKYITDDPRQNTVAGLLGFAKKNFATELVADDPDLQSLQDILPTTIGPDGKFTNPNEVTKFIQTTIGRDAAAASGAPSTAATPPAAAPTAPAAPTSPTAPAAPTSPTAPTAPAAPTAPTAPAAPTRPPMPPIQVTLKGHGIMTKHPDGKWRDEQGDEITATSDIKYLEKLAGPQRQNRQMYQPKRSRS